MTIINRKKKQFLTQVILALLAVSFCTSCVDRFDELEKYQRPDWLAGKIYTQISSQENMTIFSQFMVDTGYDKLVDKTGTYAAFVPTDSIMTIYLRDKYGTSNPDEIDLSVKADIVRYHILPMPWTKDQLQFLSADGWISMTDPFNQEPTAFKRKTLLREPNKTYSIRRMGGNDPYDIIVPGSSSLKRTVYSNSPKYVPLFFDGFMTAEGLSSDDYSFYFDRTYEAGEVYFANAKMIGDEIFAENGFVYTVDRVVEPLKNAEQLLEDGPYAQFLQLIHNFPVFKENKDATLAQEGADQGAEVETLYDLSYPFGIDIHNEVVNSTKYTVEQNYGLLIPTDEAMDEFFTDYLQAWGNDWSKVPAMIQSFILSAHMSSEPIYPSDLNSGFYNRLNDIVGNADITTIENASYGSNTTFIGLNNVIIPKFFSTASAPLFLDPAYSSFFTAYAMVNMIWALKEPATEFSVFFIDNATLVVDSSLIIPGLRSPIEAYDRAEERTVSMISAENRDILKRKLYGQIGVQPILGKAKREFVETLDGRHIVVQNDTVSGGVPSKFGYNGIRDTTVVFSEITDFPISNGRVYKSNGWLNFPTASTYNRLVGTKFLTLLNKAKLADISVQKLSDKLIDPTQRYTIFVPSDAALNSIQADTLSSVDLIRLLSFHIVKGELIFTDGRQPTGAYRTLDNRFLNLDPQPDNLIILDENQDVLFDQLVLSPRSNLIGMHSVSGTYFLSNTVVHHIDTVINPY